MDTRLPGVTTLLFLALGACAEAGDGSPGSSTSSRAEGTPSPLAGSCAADDGGLTLPEGFCAIVVADELGTARHLDVAPNGDVFVAIRDQRSRGGGGEPGGVVVLRDEDGDGLPDRRERWGERGGNDVLVADGWVYLAPDDGVLRFPVPADSMVPTGPSETLVSGLPSDRSHAAKSIAVGDDGGLYVNIGAPSNACMEQSRTRGSPGMDPCPELETRGGIWRFDAATAGQTQAQGERFATGLRNVVALRMHPETGVLYGAQHGRDQLHDLYPDMFTQEESAENPSEELVRIDRGDDFGWPYCFHHYQDSAKVLAPEYGGDGREVGRCADAEDPLVAFPGHWAPNDLEFSTGDQFPGDWRGGVFVAFHGSWNRAPLPQEGYNVVYVPFEGGAPTGDWSVFADGFRVTGADGEPDADASARPVGLAMAPDGSLYVSDSRRGKIWRIVWRGAGEGGAEGGAEGEG